MKRTNVHLILQVFSASCYFPLGPNIHRITYLQKFQFVLITWDETVALTATLSLDSYYRLFEHFLDWELQTPRVDASPGTPFAIELMLTKFA